MSKTVGNYTLVNKLGSGSYAHVYKATNNTTGELYAVKVISREKLGSVKLQENLDNEISIMRDYSHINIVRLFDHFTSSRHIYLALEYCAGGDLQKYIKRYSRIEERVARRFLYQLAQGLKFLHQKNIIHRDIKPQNLLMTDTTTQAIIKYADFGFARHLQEAAMAQTPCGTPFYMAPEIFEMQEYDAKADLWSVGCVLYEMLVGLPPFKGQNPRELFLNIRSKQLRVPSEITVSADMLHLLQQLLEINPRNRISLDVFCECAGRMFGEVVPGDDPVLTYEEGKGGQSRYQGPTDTGSPQQDTSAASGGGAESQSRRLSRDHTGNNSPTTPYPHLLSSSPPGQQQQGGSALQATPSPRPSGIAPATATMVMALASGGNPQSPQGQSSSGSVQGSHRRSGSGSRYKEEDLQASTSMVSPTSSPANKHERRYSANDAGAGSAVARALSISPQEQHSGWKSDRVSRAWEQSERVYSAESGEGHRDSPTPTAVSVHGAMTFGLAGPISYPSRDSSNSPVPSSSGGKRSQRGDGSGTGGGLEEESTGAGGDSDDFVMVEQAASHPWRVMDADSAYRPVRRGTVGDKPASYSPITGAGIMGNPSAHWYGAGSPNNTGGIASGAGNESSDVMQLSAAVHRCSQIVSMVTAMTAAADGMARDALNHRTVRELRHRHGNRTIATGGEDDDNSLGSGSSPGASSRPRLGSGDASHISELLSAPFSLYLHALGFVQDTLKRTAAMRQSIAGEASLRAQMDTLLEGLAKRFDQLLSRAESCKKYINPDDGVPVPEPLIYHAALRLGQEASVEELLGNLTM
mmetsp:Transcript_2785/g.4197  ORF Transcript_2785/g.4197 Transcript_2785/m.4197 type:complete len:808 (-) Transcript_2785:541-2964(-)